MSIQSPNKTIVTVGTAAHLSLQPCRQVRWSDLPLRRAVAGRQRRTSRRRATSRARPRRTIERMRAILTAAGSSLDQVVAVTVYLKSASDFAAMNEAYSGFWTKDPPTRTTVVADFVAARRARRDLDDCRAHRRRAGRDSSGELDQVAEPLQLRDSHRRHAVSSGLVSRNGRDNTVVTGDINVQTAVVLDNATEILKAAGMTLDNVVSSRIYLPDGASFQPMNADLPQVLQRRAAGARDGHRRSGREPVCRRDHAHRLVGSQARD